MGRRNLLLVVLAATVLVGGSAVAVSFRGGAAAVRWAGDAPVMPDGDPVVAVWNAPDDTEYLARLDPRTLRTRGHLDLGPQVQRATAVSATGDELVMVTDKGHVRVVDLQRMVDRARFPLAIEAASRAFWIEPDVVVVVAGGNLGTRLVRFDPSDGRRLGMELVPGSVFAAARVDDGLVMLLHEDYAAGQRAPSATTIAHLDAAGTLSTRVIEEIGSGYYDPDGDASSLGSRAQPALAVTREHAVVIGTDGTTATVTLDDLSVEIHEEARSLLGAVAAWFVPPAHAKTLGGTVLEATWLGPRSLLVTGHRIELTRESQYRFSEEIHPAGATIVDTSDWSTEVIDEDATRGHSTGSLALVHRVFDVGFEEGEGMGLRAYDRAGDLAWSALDGEFVDVKSVRDGIAIVGHGWDRVLVSAIDLDDGTVLKTRELPLGFVL